MAGILWEVLGLHKTGPPKVSVNCGDSFVRSFETEKLFVVAISFCRGAALKMQGKLENEHCATGFYGHGCHHPNSPNSQGDGWTEDAASHPQEQAKHYR